MNNILYNIISNKRKEIEIQKQTESFDTLINRITDTNPSHLFKEALAISQTGIISEFKRKSPSRGWIFENAQIDEIIPYYTNSGASAISVLTDTDFFGGTFDDFLRARKATTLPLLRKDFMVDEYQIYQAKAMQANVILLIASALTIAETKAFARKAKELGLEVLLEIHHEDELGYINEYIDVVGVNNRNLNTFVTDVKTSFELSIKIPDEFIRISESGISHPQTVADLRSVGYKGFLMGENFMKTGNPGKALSDFINELENII